jgi:hypothetical protein
MSSPPDAPERPVRPVSDADLRALLAQARAADDARLRDLVHAYVALRGVTREALAFLEAREGGAAVAGVPVLLRARALVAPAGPA